MVIVDDIFRPLLSIVCGAAAIATTALAIALVIGLSPIYAIVSAITWFWKGKFLFSLIHDSIADKAFQTEDGKSLGFFSDMKQAFKTIASCPFKLVEKLQDGINYLKNKDEYLKGKNNKTDRYIRFYNFRHDCVDAGARFIRGGEKAASWVTTKCRNGSKRLCERSLQRLDKWHSLT
ncbi:MAG: hypothetical protein GY821_05125 [Gammaproteobacteria bacterium]|nr:hypothetical protein [Gammaproteobacteria bacterium]